MFFNIIIVKKILIIRFSSIGDIIQCMAVTGGFKNHHPKTELHWVVRKDLASLIKIDPRIDKIWEFDRELGMLGLLKLAFQLKKEGYSHIYDAHSNIRSNIVKTILNPLNLSSSKLITRRKHRIKRILLFKFGINKLPNPFRAFESFRSPIRKWDINNFETPDSNWVFPDEIENKCSKLINGYTQNTVTLVPSAAHDLKKWPVKYWQEVITQLSDKKFIILGGPDDHFCEDIRSVAPNRVLNLTGKTTLHESFYITSKANYVLSGDTGFLHAADLFNKHGIALIGPSAFGYPSGRNMKVFEIELTCKPCSKDGSTNCKIKEIKKCLIDIKPKKVIKEIAAHFEHNIR